MKKFAIVAALLFLSLMPAGAFGFRWKAVPVDASRTGVTAPTATNVEEAVGVMKGRSYIAPNGKKFGKRTATAKVARLMLDAQPEMAPVKEVVGRSIEGMPRGGTENLLGDWAVDCIMAATAKETGRNVDIGVLNHGGIRIDMPRGDILVDDLMSMFPFNNYLCYVTLKGSDVRALVSSMAKERVQVLGGVRLTVKDGEVLELLVGGEPVDDDRIYGVSSIDFLLTGGDNVFVARNSLELIETDIKVFDAILAHVQELTAAGRTVDYSRDGRVTDLSERRR